jgi:hypothetical protein
VNVVATLLAMTLAASSTDRVPTPRRASDPRTVEARAAATTLLRHLYAVHLSLRGCAEAARRHNKPEFLPAVGLEEAKRAMTVTDEASRTVGLDVDGIWSEVAPMATVTAESLKADTPENVENCARVGSVFRIDLANLQNALRALGSTRTLIEKDF